MSLFKNLRQLVLLTIDMRSANREQGKLHRQVNQMMHPFVKECANYNDGTITPRMYKKMQWYMVEMIWMSRQFAKLYHLPLSKNEEKSIAFIGALGAISDILIDDQQSGDKQEVNDIVQYKDFLLSPEIKTAISPLEKLYLAYFTALEQFLPSNQSILVFEYYWKTLEAQFGSRQQFQPDLPQAQLMQILKDKCGFTTLLCRAIVDKPINQQEHDAIYELGALVQFINDINDLHKDSTQGIRNFANSYVSLSQIEQALLNQAQLVFEQMRLLPLKSKSLYKFLFVFYSFMMVTLSQLKYYDFICEKNYSLERFLKLPSEKTKIHPFILRNIQFSIPKILRYNFRYPFKDFEMK